MRFFVDRLFFIIRKPYYLIVSPLLRLPFFAFVRKTTGHHEPITFETWFWQKVVGVNREAHWPVNRLSRIVGAQNIIVGIGSKPGINPGCYIQGTGTLIVGDYCLFGPNVGLISGNHNLYNHLVLDASKSIYIGSYCWIGMNSVILPGVNLGDFTVVGAGSVVTRSFSEGYCVVAGNPARKIYDLDRQKCIRYRFSDEYIGYRSVNKII